MHRFAARVALVLTLLLASMALPTPAEDAQQIVLSFAGDCTLGTTNRFQNYGSGFVATVRERGFEHPFSGVKRIFEADDLTLVNLEGTFTESKKAADKLYTFRAPPEFAAILPLGSVEAVNIANNHIDDFLAQGKEDTLAALNEHGVLYSGDGVVAIFETKGVKIGMAGYSYPHRNTLKQLEESDIPRLREAGCDVIIFSMHAGTEENYRVTGTQKELARGAIDLGVDIVVGHHPHVIHTVEVYNGKPIFYSLGNFAFGGNINPPDWDTMIGQVVLEKGADGIELVEMRVIPCLISEASRTSDFRPVVATGERAAKIFQKIRRYAPDRELEVFVTGVQPLR